MMDNLEKTLSVLFKHVSAQAVLNKDSSAYNIECRDFVQLMRRCSNGYSETELKNLYQYLTCNFVDRFHAVEYSKCGMERLNVFELLRYYSDWILTVQDNEIVCKYENFLHWRTITKDLSEELLAASFLAWRKLENVGEPVRFDWKAVITHNNWELHKILNQGMAENHSHLKGTSAIFPLTWIHLMNNVYSHNLYRYLEQIDKNRRNLNTKYQLSDQERDLSIQLLQAAYIRILLFERLCYDIKGIKCPEDDDMEKYIGWLKNPDFTMGIKLDLSGKINCAQNTFMGMPLPDYAIAGFLEDGYSRNERTLVFQGERWLLYHFLQRIYSGIVNEEYQNLFYAYLIIKENFRSEFVQNNADVGFENFSIYEKRKDIFLEELFFKRELVKKAFEASLAESRAVVVETRIAPKKSAKEYYECIDQLDGWLGQKEMYSHRLFYTVHFIKQEDSISDQEYGGGYTPCRHGKMRLEYKKQAVSLVDFREKYSDYAKRIRGIDAANKEIGCNPEVFAQVFRYLSDHRLMSKRDIEKKIPQLRKSYHVGEDFLDLASGLRAIDEAVHFLGIKCGDRIGHAIALGINPEEWYQSKNYRIVLSQQEYLDNVAWLYNLGIAYGIDDKDNVLCFLRKEYAYYFQIIYKNSMKMDMLESIRCEAKRYYRDKKEEKYYNNRIYNFTIENYYSAWELRGDDPLLYKDGFFAQPYNIMNRYQSFSYYSVNRSFPKEQNKRYLQEHALLYYYYHFNKDVRREGNKTIEIKIEKCYIECVKMIQYELQKMIAQKGIGIETNPSSNVLIGTFKRYDKHPILSFYNKDLVEDVEQLQRCPQINVSINTDDAGIFGTSLENEYAYIALSLEKAKDEAGNPLYKKRNIYEWLDHIRVMGLRQTFLDDDETKLAMQKWNEEAYKKSEVIDHDKSNHSSRFRLFYADIRRCTDRGIPEK